LIVGGNAVGLETALYLANQGTLAPEVLHFLMVNRAESFETLKSLLDQGNKEVTVVEMAARAGQDIGASSRWTVMAELRRLGVKIMTGTKAVRVEAEGLEVEKENNREILPAETIVLAVGSVSENKLSEALTGLVGEIHTIGDAKEPRNALEAIQEGFRLGMEI
jgi:2,4-dienoyl-CoA reductase (NADPH2)